MQENLTYALVHSPLVGPFTWQLVCEALIGQGFKAIIPALLEAPTERLINKFTFQMGKPA